MFEFIVVAMFVACTFTAVGYIVYKAGKAESWEKGVSVVLKRVGVFFSRLYARFCAEFEANTPQDFPCPSSKDSDDLLKRLSNNPYDTPSKEIEQGTSHMYGLRVGAVGLLGKYSGISASELRERIERTIVTWANERWNTVPRFYVRYVNESGFEVFIALSEYGRKRLNAKIQEWEAAQRKAAPTETADGPLVEEVPIPKSENESPADGPLSEEVPLPGDEDAP